MTDKPAYTWDNAKHDWSDDDEYVIYRDGRVLEPGEVVDALNRCEDQKEQVARTAKHRNGYMLKNANAREGIKRIIAVFDDDGDLHDLAHVIETELRPLVEVDHD